MRERGRKGHVHEVNGHGSVSELQIERRLCRRRRVRRLQRPLRVGRRLRFWLLGRHGLRHDLSLRLRLELRLGLRLGGSGGSLRARLQGRLARHGGRGTDFARLFVRNLGLGCRLWGLDGAVDVHFHVLASLTHGIILVLAVAVNGGRSRGPGLGLLLCLLGRDFFRGQEATAWASGATHSMLVPGLVQVGLEKGSIGAPESEPEQETHLALLGEPVHLFEAGPGDPTLENAVVLLRVHVQRLLVDGGVILDLIYGWVLLAGLLWLLLVVLLGDRGREVLLLEKEVGRVRDRRGCGGRAGRRMPGSMGVLVGEGVCVRVLVGEWLGVLELGVRLVVLGVVLAVVEGVEGRVRCVPCEPGCVW